MLIELFGDVNEWPEQDLVGFTETLDADFTLAAYAAGLFPMPLHESGYEGIGWWSPVRRGVLPLRALRVSHSLKRSLNRYTTSIDRAFEQVLSGCADPSRPYGWIDEDIRAVYTELHECGWVHSVESWDEEGRLVGGLYGVSVHGLFAGESMFHDPQHGRDASKVALVRLVDELSAGGRAGLLDVQWLTPHLASLGGIEVPRSRYLALLADALGEPGPSWPEPAASIRRGRAGPPGAATASR
ncbi:leucyl/phenylalanyl-tRNA--protein transferase [Propionibacterium australiense]|uniref:leucyl/phenylalanyl-tRNA--protein transferase n=1 Tax=Propionibacterium australiense TaxID=119981 RepID=UPI001E6056ED|nr:leucyl/phenylalanyl-tRNA--protein transferase [Propionibacterium australiense]